MKKIARSTARPLQWASSLTLQLMNQCSRGADAAHRCTAANQRKPLRSGRSRTRLAYTSGRHGAAHPAQPAPVVRPFGYSTHNPVLINQRHALRVGFYGLAFDASAGLAQTLSAR
jgi:hypothetical protein